MSAWTPQDVAMVVHYARLSAFALCWIAVFTGVAIFFKGSK